MNEDKKEFLGINHWHDLGILGQDIVVASIENGVTMHSRMVLDVLKQILPKATILTSVKYWRDDEIPDKLDGYTSSLEYSDTENIEKVKKAQELSAKGVFMTCSIGNDETKKFNSMAKYPCWVSVGACRLNNGIITPTLYSSESEFLDFVEVTNWDTAYGNFNGSSCATPVLQGMAMLVKCYLQNQLHRKIGNEEIYSYIQRNCIDVKEEGFDKKTGYGLFILPKIENKSIELTIGSKNAIVNGENVKLDVDPFIKEGRTFVPIRFISENLGSSVFWNEKEKKVTILS